MQIQVEGNIGAGKSELLKELELQGYSVHREPLDKWSLLQKFYTDKKKYSFSFQTQVLASYVALDCCIQERGPRSAIEVFCTMLSEDGYLSEEQLCLLCLNYLEMPYPTISMIIYLDLSPEQCLQRINARNREGESVITLEYLQRIHEMYGLYLQGCEEEGIRVIKINAEMYNEKQKELGLEIEKQIQEMQIQ
jgi:deoxyadenosine/deoxycytidine kinase